MSSWMSDLGLIELGWAARSLPFVANVVDGTCLFRGGLKVEYSFFESISLVVYRFLEWISAHF